VWRHSKHGQALLVVVRHHLDKRLLHGVKDRYELDCKDKYDTISTDQKL
jgi:hypothetical protein